MGQPRAGAVHPDRQRGDLPLPLPASRTSIQDDGTEIDWPIPYWWVDVGATAMLILLAAVDEGLAAGFLGTHRFAELSAELGIPADQQPVGVITVGHPLPDRRSGSLKRGWVKADDFAHWERW